MTYDLFLGDPTYSSWSLRGWLLFQRFGIPVSCTFVDFHEGDVAGQLLALGLAPSRTVPCMRTPDGAVLWDSLAMAEELAQRHPEAGLWPVVPGNRATARSVAAEMHSGFTSLRSECPMNLRTAYSNVPQDDNITMELRRLEQIWDHARAACKSDTPWLCGNYSAADAFFAPIAARLAGYGLEVSPTAEEYVKAHLHDPAFRRWRAMGLARGATLPWYDKPYDTTDWPGLRPIAAQAVDSGPSVNAACPFSGKPVTHFAQIGPRVIGFCNAFCRDKAVADPEAWPEVMKINQI